MSHLADEFYLVLKPTKRYGPAVNGQRPVREFAVDRVRRGKPFTDRDEFAVRVKLIVDSAIFDAVIPNVEIELGAEDLFQNPRVEISTVEDEREPDRYEQTGE